MLISTSRRHWLKNAATILTGLSIAPNILANERIKANQSGIILLNSNENAYGPSASAKKAMMEALANSNRYPDEPISRLKQQVATHWNVGVENILLGAGSSEILGLTFLLASATKKKIISAEPSYRVWNSQAESFGMNILRVPLTSEKKLDLEMMLSAVDAGTGLVYVCNPNNPTGTHVDDIMLRNFVSECSKKTMVLVDEAYTEFSNLPSLKDIAFKNPHVVVAKTFSKIYGLAGARIGYGIAHTDTIKKLSNLQPWPDVSVCTASIAAASAALSDQAFVNDCREKNVMTREMCYKTFTKLKLDYIPSSASFILFNIDKISKGFEEKMQAKNIFVQYREHFGGKWCRVSMGTIEEMEMFCAALQSITS